MHFFNWLGSRSIQSFLWLGDLLLLCAETYRNLLFSRIRFRLVIAQIVEMGWRSQPVIAFTGAFTGAVFTAQTFFQFTALNMDTAVGPVVSVAMCRELGPVLTGLMVAGRVGAAITAELGTMRVTQQIDALRALAINPIEYLVVPRTLAILAAMPILVAEAILFGILAGWFTAVKILEVNSAYYFANMLRFTEAQDVIMGLIKAIVFGQLIVAIGCREGLAAQGGAVGVGRATTEAVVLASLAVLATNFFLTMALNIFFPAGGTG